LSPSEETPLPNPGPSFPYELDLLQHYFKNEEFFENSFVLQNFSKRRAQKNSPATRVRYVKHVFDKKIN
jgi:hypothetical protein